MLVRCHRDGGSTVYYAGRRLDPRVWCALVERQEAEIGYYNRTKGELETLKNAGTPAKDIEALWEKRNDELRQMGINLVSLPE